MTGNSTGAVVTRFRGRPAGTALSLFLIFMVVAAGFCLGGCGSLKKEVGKYLVVAHSVYDGVTGAYLELNKYWTLPLAEQGGVKQALADFRKALDKAQGLLDQVDPPEPCRELDRLLGQLIDRGKELARFSTEAADYLGDLAPLAKQASDITAKITQLPESTDALSDLAGLKDQVKALYSGLQAVITPAAFKDIGKEFGTFVQELNTDLEKAARAAGLEERQPPEETEVTAPENPEEQTSSRPYTWEHSEAQGILEDVPEKWEHVKGRISALLDGVVQASWIKPYRGDFDSCLLQIQGQVKELETKYR